MRARQPLEAHLVGDDVDQAEHGHRGAGPQDRLQHAPLRGPGGAPAAHEEHAEPDEQDDDQRRDDGVDDVDGASGWP